MNRDDLTESEQDLIAERNEALRRAETAEEALATMEREVCEALHAANGCDPDCCPEHLPESPAEAAKRVMAERDDWRRKHDMRVNEMNAMAGRCGFAPYTTQLDELRAQIVAKDAECAELRGPPSAKARHPVQPLVRVEGIVRFKENAIVRYLLDAGPFNMNTLAIAPFSGEDREQLAQLIGYSISGFGDLSYVTDETYLRAGKQPVHDE